ncbi:MAG TPA: DNA-binding response regulator [Bacteroidetes bacterium]|nr:DNA-binding response regulator [Bacteroidota bacterium]
MKHAAKTRIVIADDHQLVRAGIAALLADTKDIEVVGEAANGREAIEKVKALAPDIVLMDISMPVLDGIKAAKEISEISKLTKIIMLTQYEQVEYIRRVMHSGVSGYILKNSLVGDLTKAIRSVREGKHYLAEAVSEAMMDAYLKPADGSPKQKNHKRLTKREEEIMECISEGCSNQQIAGRLFISVRTVEFHRTNIMEKLGIHDTVNLVRYAIQRKLMNLEL